MRAEAAFYDRAIARVFRWMAAAAAAGAIAALFWRGWQGAAAFSLGAVAAYYNFRWLHEAVEALAPEPRRVRRRIFVFLGLRYAGLAAGGYVIVKIFGMNAIAALLGLFVPVAAVIIEIVYELLTWNTNSG